MPIPPFNEDELDLNEKAELECIHHLGSLLTWREKLCLLVGLKARAEQDLVNELIAYRN